MGNISNILGGSFTPPIEKVQEPPEIQLKNEMLRHGIEPPSEIIMDGQIHRFRSNTKGKSGHGDKTGWYVAYNNGVPSGVFGCWRAGIEVNFRAEIGRTLSVAEEMAYAKRMSEAKAIRDADLEKSRERASSTVELIWEEGTHASQEHGYLKRKGINPNGARVTGDGRLMVPLLDEFGKIHSIQYIAVDGDKKYHPGGATGGFFWSLGDDDKTIYIVEGFATGATVFETTNQKTVIAYSASNLVPVTKTIKDNYPNSDICIVADNDESGVGLRYAEQASAKYGVRVVMPPDKGDANDYFQSGKNLLDLLKPKEALTLLNADDMAANAKAPDYIINNILENDSHGFIIAQSQAFKTFMALQFCHSICTKSDFFGNQVFKSGKVVYVCGEGKGALARRLRGLHIKKGGFNNNLLILEQRIGIDDNLDMTNLKKLIEENKPVLVIFDTFASLVTDTDENSNKEVGVAINLIRSTCSDAGASSMAIHHTGKVGNSARGAYSFLGNCDFLFNMTREESTLNAILSCVKMKDGDNFQDIYVTAEIVNIGLERQDGTETTTLVLNINEDPPNQEKKENKATEYIKLFKSAWVFSGGDIKNEMPYITKSAMLQFLIEERDYKPRTANNKLDAGRDGDLINVLINSEIIYKHEHGWLVKDKILASSMIIEQNQLLKQ